MNDNVIIINNKIEVGSVVVSGLMRRKATVVKMLDDKMMLVRWESTGKETEVLRIGFLLA